MGTPRIARVFGALNIGSFRISAMIAGITETGETVVLGSFHRASQGIRKGFVTDMAAATYAIRDAVDRAEKIAGAGVTSVWVGCSGAGLASRIDQVEIDIGGRRIEEDDVDHLLVAARDAIQPDGRMVLHAQPAHYTLDGAHGVANPVGLHAERLGVDIHVMMADGAPIRNLTEAVQNAHLDVEAMVASPVAVSQACLGPEERELGVALVEMGADVTNVALHAGGMLVGLAPLPFGSADITDAIASTFGIRRHQAERLKCMEGSALASPSDHRQMIPVFGPSDDGLGHMTRVRHADEQNRIPLAELVSVITQQLGRQTDEIGKALKAMGFSGQRGQQVVLTGGGAALSGIADYAQSALGRPVRVTAGPQLRGLPEAHAVPDFATLSGLVVYATADPVDIRTLGPRRQSVTTSGISALARRIGGAMRDYF